MLNEGLFKQEFLRLAEFFEPPAHNPNFARALFRALTVRMNDIELHKATEMLIETFRPSYGCSFPIVSHYMQALQEVRRQHGSPAAETLSEDVRIAESEEAYHRTLSAVLALPDEEKEQLRQQAIDTLGKGFGWLNRNGLVRMAERSVEYQMVRLFREREAT